jgi:hypothetical protein
MQDYFAAHPPICTQVFNGQLLSLLGFTFANAASVPSNYYLDSAFINS